MVRLLDFPFLFSVFLFIVLWLSVRLGAWIHTTGRLEENQQEDFGVILPATLTLLSLIIGFSFSMAASRYDQRKDYEAREASAIDAEYSRADFLPPADAVKVHALLKSYLKDRILFYQTRNVQRLLQIDANTSQVETELWSAVRAPIVAQPAPTDNLIVIGMNDVLDSKILTRGSWWNRIPTSAWILMTVIAICCNMLIGFGAHDVRPNALMFFVLPFLVSISFYLIADIDSPSGGIIRVHPQNLITLSESLHGR
jgi:hypothetical protein